MILRLREKIRLFLAGSRLGDEETAAAHPRVLTYQGLFASAPEEPAKAPARDDPPDEGPV